MTAPLDGIVVVDLSQAVSGPFCAQLLADFGATVIKVEPLGGEIGRFVGPFPPGDTARNHGGVYQNVNRNKRGMAVDLKSEAGKRILLDLVRTADVLVENFSAGVMERLGLGAATLSELNPRLVYTSVRGFGDRVGGESPYRTWPAFDIVAQAMGGIMGITGPDAEHPLRVGGAVGDTVPGIYAALGTVLALLSRQRTGVGQEVDIAMVDSVLSIAEVAVNQFAHTGVAAHPLGNTLPGVAPFNTYRAADGVVAIGAPHRSLWLRLCEIMGRAELADDPRFGDDQLRVAHAGELDAIIGEWAAERTVAELTGLLGGLVPFGPVFTGEEIFADEHFRVRAMLPEVEGPDGGTVRVTGVVPKLSQSPGAVRVRAPKLGEHTRELLAELGLDTQRIDELVADGVVGDLVAGVAG